MIVICISDDNGNIVCLNFSHNKSDLNTYPKILSNYTFSNTKNRMMTGRPFGNAVLDHERNIASVDLSDILPCTDITRYDYRGTSYIYCSHNVYVYHFLEFLCVAHKMYTRFQREAQHSIDFWFLRI